jgi:hypothetical protein
VNALHGYRTLLGPIEPLIKDKSHVILVPSGALTGLPFQVLLTDAPQSGDVRQAPEREWSAFQLPRRAFRYPQGLVEPALALSAPAAPNERDDGLLTASEAALLSLNADCVVFSACNTAAGDRPGAEALWGLARAFFYAGARALLVSH